MTLAASVHVVANSTESPDEVVALNDDEWRMDKFEAQSKELLLPSLNSGGIQQFVIMATVGSICMMCIVGLLASAFVVDPSPESCIDYDVTVMSETSQTLLAFVMGWAVCFLAKHRQDLSGQVSKMSCSAAQLSALVCSSTSSFASAATGQYQSMCRWFSSQGQEIGRALGLTMVVTMCIGVIFALFISAFTAVPDEVPTDDGFASESSQTMKAFTVGWIFVLSYKLRRELVEVGGCLMEPF